MIENKFIAGEKVNDGAAPSKPKRVKGCIRERAWKLQDGTISKVWRADAGMINGKRKMKQFDTKEAAKNWLWEMSLMVTSQGQDALRLSSKEREDAIRALDALKEHTELPVTGRLETLAQSYCKHHGMLKDGNATVTEVIESYSKHNKMLKDSKATVADAIEYFLKMRPADIQQRRTLSDAIAEHLQDAKDRRLRDSTLKNMKQHLDHFAKRHTAYLVSEITRDRARLYIRGIEGSPRTRALYRRYAHGLFEYCMDAGLIAEGSNPFASRRGRSVTDGRKDEKMPEFLTPGQVLKILMTAREKEPALLPALALGFFAGLRTSEARQISWEQIDFAKRLIRVLPAIAKGRRVRNVEMSDAFIAWAFPYRRETGLVAPQGRAWRTMTDNVISVSQIKWVKNGLRHSYATYHFAMHENAVKTSYELGHNSAELLFKHYRGLSDKEQAAEFWNIRPDKDAKDIAFSRPA